MVVSFVQIILFSLVAFIISWQITLICQGIAILTAIPLFLLTRLNYNCGKERVKSSLASTSIAQESFSLAKIIHAFARQKISETHFEFETMAK